MESFYVDQNFISGTISTSLSNLIFLKYLALDQNLLSGIIPQTFQYFTKLVSLDLFGNVLTGSLPLALNTGSTLQVLDLADNLLSGKLPQTLFSTNRQLQAIIVNNNLFTGLIPAGAFNSPFLFSAILAVNCFSGTLPKAICSSNLLAQVIFDGLHSAPSCSDRALKHVKSSGLISKNNVHGHIPSCLLQHKHLSVLHLGGNSFSGSIPNVPISAAMTELVLSSNQLTGSIPDSIWQSNITKLDLSLNRLQGTLPSDMLPAAQSQVQSELSEISTFSSISNITVLVKLQVNQLAGTIPSWLQSLPSGDINLLEGNLFSCNADRSDLPANDPKAATYECGSDNTNYGLIAFGTALFFVGMTIFCYWYFCRGVSNSEFISTVKILASFCKHYGESEVKKLWEHIERAVYVIVGMWMLGMVVYGLLSLQFSIYADTYVWAVSAIYKLGMISSLLLGFIFAGAVFVGILLFSDDIHFNMKIITNERVLVNFKALDILIMVAAIMTNIVIVIAINGLYIYTAVSDDVDFSVFLFLAILLSLFKIAWNFFLLRSNQIIAEITDNTIVWLSLFNNLLAPLLAEMLVSPDCFLYVVTQAPLLQFSYKVVFCQQEITTHNIIQVCNLPVLLAQGYGTKMNVSITPPFHYSYQCSFSLIASYAFVFTFRYVISGLVEPMVRIWVVKNAKIDLLNAFLPMVWQTLIKMESAIGNADSFRNTIQIWQDHVVTGRYRTRIIAVFATDISMLLCFGALFPPLAVIIALSVLKDVMSIRLALGRYCEIMEAVQDESLKEQMVKVRESMDEEMLKAGAGIWNGVWYGMVMGTWIWGFVLFDTMASVEGVGKGLCVFVGMVCCPFFFVSIFWGLKRCLWKLLVHTQRPNGCVERDVGITSRRASVSMFNSILERQSLMEMIALETEPENVVQT
jgi:hypothetical protein